MGPFHTVLQSKVSQHSTELGFVSSQRLIHQHTQLSGFKGRWSHTGSEPPERNIWECTMGCLPMVLCFRCSLSTVHTYAPTISPFSCSLFLYYMILIFSYTILHFLSGKGSFRMSCHKWKFAIRMSPMKN